MPGTETYSAPRDVRVVVITAIVSIVLLAGGIFAVWLTFARASGGTVRALILLGGAAPAVGTLAVTASYAPRAYVIDSSAVRIERISGEIVIPLVTVQSVERLPASELRRAVRTFGVGGLFGYYGEFENPSLGRYRMYASRGGDYVVLRTTEGTIVITPESPDRFVNNLRGRVELPG